MTKLNDVAKGVRIFALLSNIPPGQQTVIPRKLLEGAAVPGQSFQGVSQTPEFIIGFFHKKLLSRFHHTVSYDDKARAWTFYRPREGELVQ